MKTVKTLYIASAVAILTIVSSCREDSLDQRAASETSHEQDVPSAELTTASATTVSPSPLWCPKSWFQNGSVSSYSYDPVMSDGACFYMGQSGESCNTVCGHFYGVDATKSGLLAKNANKCNAMIKSFNPQQANLYMVGTSGQAPAGSACGWVITGKFPKNQWFTVSGSSFSPTTSGSTTSQVCSCQVYDYPNYNGLGLTYHNAKGTSGNVGKAMSILPTYLTGKIADSNPYTNGKYSLRTNNSCTVDPKTPLPPGLALRPKNCEIYGTPTAVIGPTTIVIYAIDSTWDACSPMSKSNPAPVTLTISK